VLREPDRPIRPAAGAGIATYRTRCEEHASLFFAFDPSSLNDEVLCDIVSTVHLDASLIDQALQQAADGGASS
jgi:hypothetical protein